MKRVLMFSLFLNALFLFAAIFIVYQRGGISYLKQKAGVAPVEKKDIVYVTKKSIFQRLPNESDEIIFLGNSLMDMCEWHELLQNPNIKNRGIGGDVIGGVLERLDEITKSNPSKIFVMLGTNDLGRGKDSVTIINDYITLIEQVRRASPDTEMFIHSILPTRNFPDRKNSDIVTLNKGLKEICSRII